MPTFSHPQRAFGTRAADLRRHGRVWLCAFACATSLVLPIAVGSVAFASSPAETPHTAKASAVEHDPDVFDVVVIDAGHGGTDHGAIGVKGLHEKEVVLDVAKRLAKALRRLGLKVVMTRDGDRFLSLEERTSIANDARADLFVSIHANSSESHKPRGIETFFASLDATDESARAAAARENEVFGEAATRLLERDPLAALLGDMIATEHLDDSSQFAKLAQKELAKLDEAGTRGVKQAPFVVLMGVQMPASLVEIGFLSNPTEERDLRKGQRRDEIADALARAVTTFRKRYDARRGIAFQAVPAPSAAPDSAGR